MLFLWVLKHQEQLIIFVLISIIRLIFQIVGIKITFGLNLIELKNGSSEIEKPKGLIPDNYIHYTIQEILNGKDKEMEWIIKHITIN